MLRLDPDLQEAVHCLWDELADFGVDQSGQASAHLMAFLSERVGAWNATWAGAVRFDSGIENDPLLGWRVGAVQVLHAIPDEAHFRLFEDDWDRRKIDPSFLLPMRDVGAFRTYSFRRELPDEWFRSALYERLYGSVGTHDAVFVAFPLNRNCESHFGFYSGRTFTDLEIALLAYALRGIKWLHRHLILHRGLLIASSPLTATEQRVLALLLTEVQEKEIADQLGLAVSTVHQYVIRIYRKFGVRSRPGLMTLWLSRAG